MRRLRFLVPTFLVVGGACFGQSLNCVANGGVNTPVRAEGLTELVGDFVVTCTGGVPIAAGAPVPTVNVQIFLNTQLTSRCLGSASSQGCLQYHSEALLILDDPAPASQYGCPNPACTNVGTGTGAGGYGPGAPGTAGNNKNVFQGIQTASNSVTFIGIPIDPPGNAPGAQRIIRITNLRANANALGVASGQNAPTSVTATITTTPQNVLPISGLAIQAIASVQVGMATSVIGNTAFQQTIPENPSLATDPNGSGVSQFSLRFRELFTTAFKKRNTATTAADPAALSNQNDPRVGTYSTETGFYNSSLTIPYYSTQSGISDAGTGLMARFYNIPSGVLLFSRVTGIVTGGGPGAVRRVNADVNGAGPYTPMTGNSFGIAPIPVVNGVATAVYEVVESDPNSFATVDIPIYVAYSTPPSGPLPSVTTVNLSYAPSSTTATAVAANVPRFADTSTAVSAFTIDTVHCAAFQSGSTSVTAPGGPASVSVATEAGCQWTAQTSDSWITVVPSGPSHAANEALNFSAEPNTTSVERQGVIFLHFVGQPSQSDRILRVIQAGKVCSYAVVASGLSFPVAGGTGSVTVTTNDSTCSWIAEALTPPGSGFITVTSGVSGIGSGTLEFLVTENPGAAHVGYLIIHGEGQAVQTIAITQEGQSVPHPVSVEPTSGSGTAQPLEFLFYDEDGWQDLRILNVLINHSLDGRQACYIAFLPTGPSSGTVYLVNNAGDAAGPFETLLLPGTGTISNGQCTITGAGSSVYTAGGIALKLTLATTFSAGFTGNKVMYLAARDAAQHNSGWRALGVWSVPGPPTTGPAVTAVFPAHGASQQSNYGFSFSDTNGFQDLKILNILINNGLDGRNACYVAYVPSGPTTGTAYLVNDAGDAGGPFVSVAIPSLETAGNSQCTINGFGSNAVGNGNALGLTLNFSFAPGFSGSRIIYAAARSNTLSSGWQAVGTINVP